MINKWQFCAAKLAESANKNARNDDYAKNYASTIYQSVVSLITYPSL